MVSKVPHQTTNLPGCTGSAMVSIIGNGHGDPSSIPGQGCLYFTQQ